jgi:hypothetical protein
MDGVFSKDNAWSNVQGRFFQRSTKWVPFQVSTRTRPKVLVILVAPVSHLETPAALIRATRAWTIKKSSR